MSNMLIRPVSHPVAGVGSGGGGVGAGGKGGRLRYARVEMHRIVDATNFLSEDVLIDHESLAHPVVKPHPLNHSLTIRPPLRLTILGSPTSPSSTRVCCAVLCFVLLCAAVLVCYVLVRCWRTVLGEATLTPAHHPQPPTNPTNPLTTRHRRRIPRQPVCQLHDVIHLCQHQPEAPGDGDPGHRVRGGDEEGGVQVRDGVGGARAVGCGG